MERHDKWRKLPDATESYQNYIGTRAVPEISCRICLLAKVSSTCELTRYSGTCYRHGTSAEFPPDDHPYIFDPSTVLDVRFWQDHQS